MLFFCISISYSQDDWREYVANSIIIRYPDNWSIRTINGVVFFTSPALDSTDTFQENVNFMQQDLTGQQMNLQEYSDLTLMQVIENLGESAVISLKDTKLAGKEAKEFVYKLVFQERVLKIKQYWFIHNDSAYLFTYTAEPAQFVEFENVATKIIGSFNFL